MQTMANISTEEKYRRQALSFLSEINSARELLPFHKPSVGYIGESLLIKALKAIVPNEYGVCQGFVRCNDVGNYSHQCDIIIYKRNQAIFKSFGDIKIVKAESVVSVIEVKSSITANTFRKTMRDFGLLSQLGVLYKYLFVYGPLTRHSIEEWLLSHKSQNLNETINAVDVLPYDKPDNKWLPNGIISLKSKSFYTLEITPYDKGDWFGYASYASKDKDDDTISNLQEFFSFIMLQMNLDITIDINDYSFKNGIPLFPC